MIPADQQVRGDSQARTFGDAIDPSHQLDPAPGCSSELRQEIGERLLRALHAGWNDARCDHTGLQQSQVVARKIEDLGQSRDVHRCAEIDAGQPQNWSFDDAEIGFHRGSRRIGIRTANREIHRDIQYAGAFREIHSEEEDVAPAAMSKIHADRSAFAKHREDSIHRARQSPHHLQRVVGGMAGARHPLIAANGAHAAPDLRGQGLEGEPVIGGSERAGGRCVHAFREKQVDRLIKAAVENLLESREADWAPIRHAIPKRKVEAVNGVKEKLRANPFVEIAALAPEPVERSRFGDEVRQRSRHAERIEGTITYRRRRRRDDVDEFTHAVAVASMALTASNSSNCASTSCRSRPASARAICAVRSP